MKCEMEILFLCVRGNRVIRRVMEQSVDGASATDPGSDSPQQPGTTRPVTRRNREYEEAVERLKQKQKELELSDWKVTEVCRKGELAQISDREKSNEGQAIITRQCEADIAYIRKRKDQKVRERWQLLADDLTKYKRMVEKDEREKGEKLVKMLNEANRAREEVKREVEKAQQVVEGLETKEKIENKKRSSHNNQSSQTKKKTRSAIPVEPRMVIN